jgi:Domain of unknown function (DUF4333)
MKRLLIAGIVTSGAFLIACSADATDFKQTAEKVISSEWKSQFDEDLTDVVCADPASTDIGTSFDCTATGADGTPYTFTATITKEDEVTVNQTG